jgi:16S rRNA G1207 methylase RsmC
MMEAAFGAAEQAARRKGFAVLRAQKQRRTVG